MPRFISSNLKSNKSNTEKRDLRTTVNFLKSVITDTPDIMIILGSGLGKFADSIENPQIISYADIPLFKKSTAPGHAGRLVFGNSGGKKIVVMQGRFHVYEGYSPYESAYPVHAAAKLGIKKLIISCACGGINTDYRVGDMVLINDYINFTHTSPLVGFDHKEYGDRFIDMSNAFNEKLIATAKKAAEDINIELNEGVYFYMPGPQFETPAEIKAIKNLGADLVGMSLVHEAVMARRCGVEILAIGLVSNMACGISKTTLSEKDVLVAGAKAQNKFNKLVNAVLTKM